jgi:hypothetical protein
MEFQTMTPAMFATVAREVFGKKTGYSNKTIRALDNEICESLIGTSYEVCSELWNLISPTEIENLIGGHPKHLLWALLFLKCYCTEPIDGKTFRKWAWLFVSAMAGLKQRVVSSLLIVIFLAHSLSKIVVIIHQIVWKNCFRHWDGIAICLISVDGTDCPIEELYPFDKGIFSEKLNGPGYKYEVGVCISTADIVWVNGPFKAGRADKTIFQEDGLRDALCNDKCVEADAGYQGDDKLKNPNISQSRKDRKEKSKVRGRHENVNGFLKKFSVLANVFRHKLKEKHQMCFEAIAVITQLCFEFHGHLYDVEYNAKYN